MKKSKPLLTWIDAGIFPCKIMLSVGFDYSTINKHLTKVKAFDWKMGISQDKELIEGGTCFSLKRTVENKKTGKGVTYFYVIITRLFDFSDWDMVMLAHEILHTCQFMLPELLDRNREYECEAYLHSHLMTQALKLLRT